MSLFAVSDAVWLGIIGILAMVVKEYFDQKRAEAIAKKAEKVETALGITTQQNREHLAQQDMKLDEVVKTGEKTHTLVNSNMGAQLLINAELARWKADQTGDPQHEEAARKAEAAHQEHVTKQKAADENEQARKMTLAATSEIVAGMAKRIADLPGHTGDVQEKLTIPDQIRQVPKKVVDEIDRRIAEDKSEDKKA